MNTTIDLLRHGEVGGPPRLLGHHDVPLSDTGWAQLRKVATSAELPWEVIIASPLQRCARFAEELSRRQDLKLIIEPRLREISFGDWENQPMADLPAEEQAAMQQFRRNPLSTQPPGGEIYTEFEQRVFAAWDELLAEQNGRHALVIVHGGVIRVLLRRVLMFPAENLFYIDVPYACLSRISRYAQETPRLVFHGGAL